MSTVLFFPGQGSQEAGMGGDLFDAHPGLVDQADEILGYSVRQLCLEDAGRLRRTEFAQPALYVVGALAFLARPTEAPAPAFLAGHSLGELTALFAAGCVDFATGLRIVRRRAELMGAAPAGGGMLAVLGVPLDRLLALVDRAGIKGVEVANHNLPGQVVLAGPARATRAVASALAAEQLGRSVPLNVSVAAHSSAMAEAAAGIAAHLAGVILAEPAVPVIANVTARPHRLDTLAENLVLHLTQPVRWWDTLCLLAREGVDAVEEIGPGRVLTKMWERALPDLPPAAAARPVPPRPAPVPAPVPAPPATPEPGSPAFREDYGAARAYAAGSLAHGVAGPEMLLRLRDAGLVGFLGTAGRSPAAIGSDLRDLTGDTTGIGIGLPVGVAPPEHVDAVAELAVRHGLRHAEAPAAGGVADALLRWRFTGPRSLLVKVGRLSDAERFLRPPPREALERLVRAGVLGVAEARAAERAPVATDVCVEAMPVWLCGGDSGPALLPAVVGLRDGIAADLGYERAPRVGAGGGLGTPSAVAAAFLSGADFVLTGSVNQCTPEARTSNVVKDLLATLDVDDTVEAPAGERFELGGRGRVVRRGTLFGPRAELLFRAYRDHGGLHELPGRTRRTIERDLFGEDLESVGERVGAAPAGAARSGEDHARHRMAAVFRSYFERASALALDGVPGEQFNYRIPCGPAMGAFNRYAAGTALAPWSARRVDVVATALLDGARDLLAHGPGRTVAVRGFEQIRATPGG